MLKTEIQNKHEFQMKKCLKHLSFGFLICFEFQYSDFGFFETKVIQ